MAIPTDGGGSEVLKRNSIDNQSTTETKIDWASEQTSAGNTSGTVDVPAEVIITILNIIICNRDTDVKTFKIDINNSGSPSQVSILFDAVLPSKGTYIFSDKLVLLDNDQLLFDASHADIDIYLNYIYQDWT
jgi:hypothetical protein